MKSSTLKTGHYKNVTPKLKAPKKLHNGQQLMKIYMGKLLECNVKSNVKRVLCEQATLGSIYTECIIQCLKMRHRAVEWEKMAGLEMCLV